jgi:UDP-GlcNAc:undecaprenyl-phosphate GlcNAc-1-phosphate transferase
LTTSLQALLACALTAALILALRVPAERIGLVDHPGGRKRHDDVVPLTGGLALTLGFYFALATAFPALEELRVLLVAIAVLAAVGVADDLAEVRPRTKLLVQLVAAALMAFWGEHLLLHLGDLVGRGRLNLGLLAVPLTVFATVAVVNGINMLDGIDGLAGGLVAVMLGYFALFAFVLGEAGAMKVIVVLLGAVIGFLLFNAPHPWPGGRIFMGDTGSLVLGFAVAWFTIDLTQRPAPAVPPVVMLWVVGVVLFDLFTVTVRRALQGRNPTAPDRLHIHHLLLRSGFSPVAALLLLLAANAALGAIGTVGWLAGLSEAALFAGFLATGGLYFAVLLDPTRLLRRRRRRAQAQAAPEEETRPVEIQTRTFSTDRDK